jgi:hypothetical protein
MKFGDYGSDRTKKGGQRPGSSGADYARFYSGLKGSNNNGRRAMGFRKKNDRNRENKIERKERKKEKKG